MKQLFKSALILAVCMTSAAFTSCDDNDDNENKKKVIAIESVVGNYAGTFDFKGEPSELNPNGVEQKNVPIEIKVENGKVVLPEFPAATLVTALLGEEGAAGILPMLGKISYGATIGKADATTTTFSAPLTTTRLDIPVGPEGMVIMTVMIDITSPNNMVYTEAGKTLTFTLKTLKGQLGTADGVGDAFDLVNMLTFKVTKK